eukprot:scaffold383_cov351-Pavlova_lutheri.AAC.4
MMHATMRATSKPCTRLSRSPARLSKCRRAPRVVARAQREEVCEFSNFAWRTTARGQRTDRTNLPVELLAQHVRLTIWFRSSLGFSNVQKSVHDTVDHGVRQFFSRYDVLSPGLGVMCVTSYCVAKGQDPWTAIGISFAATVLALVLSEAMDEFTCSKK